MKTTQEIQTGQIWKSNNTGRRFLIWAETRSFVELIGEDGVLNMATYGGWKTKVDILVNYTQVDEECCKTPDYDTRVETHNPPKSCTGNYCQQIMDEDDWTPEQWAAYYKTLAKETEPK